MTPLLTDAEATALLGFDKHRLTNWRFNRCGLPFYRLGHKTPRYRLRDLEPWIGDLAIEDPIVDRWLGAFDVAYLLRLQRPTIDDWMNGRHLPRRPPPFVGKRIHEQSLDAWIEEHKERPGRRAKLDTRTARRG